MGKNRSVKNVHYDNPPPFLIHFHNPHAHNEIIDPLEERYIIEECTIRTIFGDLQGHSASAGREVAQAIERQARFDIPLFNVDVRLDQHFMADTRSPLHRR